MYNIFIYIWIYQYQKGTMDRELAARTVVLLWLAALCSQANCQECDKPADVSGTRHNGSADTYPAGTVLRFACDTGYTPNYDLLIITCVQSTGWNPSDFKCELSVVSLVIAIVVALVGIIIFVFAVAWLLKRRNETDSRRIKRKQREASRKRYAQRTSGRSNGHVNGGMATDMEMSQIGMPMRANGSATPGNDYADTNGLLWNPPSARGTVKQDYDVAVLQRSRMSSTNSESGRSATNNNAPPKGGASGVELKPDYGDVEFGAPDTNLQNIRDIGSTVTALPTPTMGSNPMEMSLPMPDANSPTMTTTATTSTSGPSPTSNMDFNNLYASVDYSKKKSSKKGTQLQQNGRALQDEQKQVNNNNSRDVEAAVEAESGYSAIGRMSAHEEAMEAEDDYAVVQRVGEEAPQTQNESDFDGLYAKVKK